MADGAPAINRRRLTLRRVLLAVTLAVAAWWGVGWWLSPRPLYTLRYAEPERAGASRGSVTDFLVTVDDQQRLLVIRPDGSTAGQATVEQFDLRSGQRLGTETWDEYVRRMQVSKTGDGLAHYVHLTPPSLRYSVRTGRMAIVPSRLEPEPTLFLIPGSSQSVRVVDGADPADRFVDQVVREVGRYVKWFDRAESAVGVWDEGQTRLVWAVREDSDAQSYVRVLATRDLAHVIIHQRKGEEHVISVLAVPLTVYSPWWARGVGVLVLAVALLRRRWC